MRGLFRGLKNCQIVGRITDERPTHSRIFLAGKTTTSCADRLHSTRGATILTLLDYLTRKYEAVGELMFASPGPVRALLTSSSSAGIHIFLAGLDRPLDDGDVIALFPPIAGG